LSHVLQDSPLINKTDRYNCQQTLEKLSQFYHNDFWRNISNDYNEHKHKNQCLGIRDILVKSLQEGCENSGPPGQIMASLSDWLSQEAQLRRMFSSRWNSPNMYRDYRSLIDYIFQYVDFISSDSHPVIGGHAPAMPPFHEGGPTLACRRLARTQNGLLGFVPATSKIGDGVTYLNGCLVPLIIREVPVENRYILDNRIKARFQNAHDIHEDYMAKGSLAASDVKHVVIIGMSFFDEIPRWNGNDLDKWCDLYALH
jgi:hypothetical protein